MRLLAWLCSLRSSFQILSLSVAQYVESTSGSPLGGCAWGPCLTCWGYRKLKRTNILIRLAYATPPTSFVRSCFSPPPGLAGSALWLLCGFWVPFGLCLAWPGGSHSPDPGGLSTCCASLCAIFRSACLSWLALRIVCALPIACVSFLDASCICIGCVTHHLFPVFL